MSMTTVAVPDGMRQLTREEVKEVAGGPVVCPVSGQQPNGQETPGNVGASDGWRACPVVTPTS